MLRAAVPAGPTEGNCFHVSGYTTSTMSSVPESGVRRPVLLGEGGAVSLANRHCLHKDARDRFEFHDLVAIHHNAVTSNLGLFLVGLNDYGQPDVMQQRT